MATKDNSHPALAAIKKSGVGKVKVAVSDIDGILRGKYLHKDKFFGAAEGGFGFCDVVFGWDSSDTCNDNTNNRRLLVGVTLGDGLPDHALPDRHLVQEAGGGPRLRESWLAARRARCVTSRGLHICHSRAAQFSVSKA